jgi:hypothetical protein
MNSLTRRGLLLSAVAAAGGALLAAVRSRLVTWTRLPEFSATPPLVPHDRRAEARTVWVASGAGPAENVDAVLHKLGGIGRFVGPEDVVLIKVSAQWWNQGMTNVAAVRRVIEHVLALPGFGGEVLVIENTHFRLADGSGLSRAFTHESQRNVDVPGWTRMGDLLGHFARAPVSFVGLVDAGPSALSGDAWHDPGHHHGIYGGDGRGPRALDSIEDGYRWDLQQAFRKRRSLFGHAQTPLTWPVFTSPRSGLQIDLKEGLFRREGDRRIKVPRRLTYLCMPTANEHSATGLTGCCKAAMGLVDMSAGRLGTDPRVRDYQSVHYFGYPEAPWRMAGPLAHFARLVRAPDLYIVTAEWVAATPPRSRDPGPWGDARDIRLEESSAYRLRTVLAGTDPVAVDAHIARHLLMPLDGGMRHLYDLDNPDSRASRFLRYYRQVYGSGTLDPELIHVA